MSKAILYQLVDPEHDVYRSVFLQEGDGALGVLRAHYTSDSEVGALIEGGDLAALGETPEQCTYFARDRAAGGVEPTTVPGPVTPVAGFAALVFDGETWSDRPGA
jgi:hypothetical protein